MGALTVLFALAILSLLTGGVANAAQASGASQHAAQPTAPPHRAYFSAVSCKGSLWCMAVGSYADRSDRPHAMAQEWTGTRWRRLSNPLGRGPSTLSCSAAWFCMADGGPTGAQTWNGRNWRAIKRPVGGLAGVSCGRRTTCMVIDGGIVPVGNGGVVASWNGRKWRIWRHATDVCSGGAPGLCGLASVACGSASNCVAVGTMTVSQEPDQETVGVAWNGTRWSRTSPPEVGGPLFVAAMNAISCAGKFCMAAGGALVGDGNVALAGAWNATSQSWQDVSPNLGDVCQGFSACPWASQISCGSASNCMTIGRSGMLAWDGSSWRVTTPLPPSSFGGLACGGSSCMAVGSQIVGGVRQTLAELWDGSTWRVISTPNLG